MELQLKRVPLKDIKPDPKQPRKNFDTDELNDLAESITEKGVLSPILLRPSGKGFMIVYGERRYRASLMAKIKDIPAVIRELSDQEALEIQLIENLQRHNPHPMEEAVGFKALLDMKQMTIEQIAHKLGKKEFYIRQRLALNNLSDEWQKAFYKGVLTIADAIKITVLPADSQHELYESEVDEPQMETDKEYRVEITKWDIDKFKGDLTKTVFALIDVTIDKKMGACVTCQFNTSVYSLFAEDAEHPRCTNISCFKNKTAKFVQLQLEHAKKDPYVVIISSSYNASKSVKDLIDDKTPLLHPYKDYSLIDEPEKPIWEQIKEDADDDDTEDDLKKQYARELKAYDEEYYDYQKKISSGKYVRAFVLDGEDAGKYTYVELKHKNADTVSSDDPQADVKNEIARLKEKEDDQFLEDNKKIHRRIVETMSSHEPFINKTGLLSIPELIGLAAVMYDRVDMEVQDQIDEMIGADEGAYSLVAHLDVKGKDAIPVAYKIIRKSLCSLLSRGDDPTSDAYALSLRMLASDYIPDTIKMFQAEQAEISKKRIEKLNKRLAELEAQLTAQPAANKKSSKTKKAPTA